MAKRIAQSTLNASTINILNVIRQNAGYDYQQSVPVISQENDIPRVGDIICGTPALANTFLNALVNRIAIVRMNSATFNNPYSVLKKGYLEFGETIENIFVNLAKAVDYNPDKAEGREFKRSIPDVRSSFAVINWRVMYPVTISDEELKTAFLSTDGVTQLIEKIVDSVYTGAEYDEFLLFKYLLIKAVTKGIMYPIAVDDSDTKNWAKAFRGKSNLLPFIKNEYNEAGVRTNTPKDRQIIFMDSNFNANYDVEVLASAFNMDKADFMGRLFLIDDFTSFDNERFDVIRANSDGLEEVTEDELNLMKDVEAILLDEDWFLCYDNKNKFTEKYVSSGLYWNYFYHVWKTVSHNPFANALVFAKSSADTALPTKLTYEIVDKSICDEAIVLSLALQVDGQTLAPHNANLIQTEALTEAGIAVQKFGAILIPASQFSTDIEVHAEINGLEYVASTKIKSSANVGDTITCNKIPSGGDV